MFNTVQIFADHKDLIHDVAYDYHGKRIATCSSDQSVKVWDQNENGQWICSSSWKVHNGSVWKVIWAHPEYGQILATCSFDRTAAIWEEVVRETDSMAARRGGRGTTDWVRKSTLVDSRSNVTDISFAPKHLGLQLGTCSQNGIVRIYEAPDIMNLNHWNLQSEITVPGKNRASSISWNPSRFHPPMIAAGCDDPNATGGKVAVFEYSENIRKWKTVETMNSITSPVYDVRFAPNIGRSYHLLAVASTNLHVFAIKPIHQQTLDSGENNANSTSTSHAYSSFQTTELATLDLHGTQIWRVSWNVTGTVLASSGADGTVKLWKANYMGDWKCINSLKASDSKLDQSLGREDGRYY